MSAETVLGNYEERATDFKTNVFGKHPLRKKGKGATKKALPALFVITLVIIGLTFTAGSYLLPSAISERLVEETSGALEVDAKESNILAFQQLLLNGEIMSNTRAKLKSKGVLVGKVEDGAFVEDANGTVLKFENKIITAEELGAAVHTDVALYSALGEIINAATYSPISYYYDEPAMEVFKKIGTSRNNYTGDEDFETVMSRLMGEGSNIDANSVVLVEKEDKNGKKYYEYETLGGSAKSGDQSFITTVADKSLAENSQVATLNAATTLNTADKISREQRSMLYYLVFTENISKVKAGDGDKSKINEAMSYLYEERETRVVDTETGEIITMSGRMVDSPSLYAVLSGERVNVSDVKNFSSDAVLETVENRLGVADNSSVISGTVASSKQGVNGSIGRYINNGAASASTDVLSVVVPTINSSLVNNSFSSIGGIDGGELLVEGAVNVSKALARASGATAGDAEAVRAYARLSNSVLAMDAKVDRMNRSPLDITSKNTFLGSILYKFALSMQKSSSVMRGVSGFAAVLKNSIAAILPTTRADDEADSYLTNFGDCETLESSIGAVGSATCATIVTFDTSTMENPFNDPGFISFVEENTILSGGVRKVKPGSKLAKFIAFNDERSTPDGIIDGSILTALMNDSTSATYTSDILSMTKTWLSASEENKRIASGAAFVNSSSNPDWDEYYKYAQRYVSLARAVAALKELEGDYSVYNNFKYFEGNENPVVAFLREYKNLANN